VPFRKKHGATNLILSSRQDHFEEKKKKKINNIEFFVLICITESNLQIND